jgi:hypothetical protein
MLRSLLGSLALLMVGSLATAEPPSDSRVVRWAEVPAGTGILISTTKVMKGLLLPVPRLGFVQLPVELWNCDVEFTPPGAPAGTPQIRRSARFFTLAD